MPCRAQSRLTISPRGAELTDVQQLRPERAPQAISIRKVAAELHRIAGIFQRRYHQTGGEARPFQLPYCVSSDSRRQLAELLFLHEREKKTNVDQHGDDSHASERPVVKQADNGSER